MSKNRPDTHVPSTARRSGLPRLTSAFPSVLQSRFHSSGTSPPSESFLSHSSSPLSRFQPLALKRVFSGQTLKEKNQEQLRNVESAISVGCTPRATTSSCSSWIPNFHSKSSSAPWDPSPTDETEYRETYRDDSSTFSRQLAKITRGSDEDIWGSCSPCLSGPRPIWPADGSHNSIERLKVTKEAVGRKVLISGKEEGTLRYFGRTAFASGHWCGIELDKPLGKNDGSVNEVIYFSCAPGHGIFAPENKVSVLLEYSETEFPMKRPKYGPNKTNETLYRLSTGSSSSSSSGLSGHSIDSKRSSGGSSATYTIVGRASDSFPTTPEEYRLSKVSKRNSACIEEGELGSEIMNSPGDGTYEDSSLGILSPDQMPDFTATGSTSIERSPSDEDVAALEDEVCDEIGAVGVDSSFKKWDSQGSISGIEEELLQRDISVIIRELKRKEVDSSSASSSPSIHNTVAEEKSQHESNESNLVCEVSVRSKSKVADPFSLTQNTSLVHGEPINQSYVTLEKKNDQKVAFDVKIAEIISESSSRVSKNENEQEVSEWNNERVANMTTSAASLDQGYQGDGEFDAPSEPGSVTASSPFEDPRLFERVIDIDRLAIDQNSTSATDADISLADDDAELENAIIPRDRTARIIDGKLYHNHREIVAFRQIEGRHDAHTSEMDSSGFYSDLDPRDEESTRFEVPPLQPLEESKLDSDLHDSVLDDTTHEDDALMEYATVTKPSPSETDSSNLCINDRQPTNEDTSLIEDEERSSTSTIRSESKDLISSSDQHAPLPSDSSTATNLECNKDLPPNNSSEEIDIPKQREKDSIKDEHTQDEVTPLKKEDMNSLKSESDSLSPASARNYEKPWLSKPLTPKKVEKPKVFLPPPPPMPKKNVQSKLKALLEASNESPNEERRVRQARKGRWDEVMSRIEEGKKEDKVKPKVKEVRSRLMDALKAPQPISPQVERIRQERRERRERRERQAAATAVARRMSERKRSNASNRASRAPSLDSIGGPIAAPDSRASTPEISQHSTSSSATSGGIGTPSSGRLSSTRDHRLGSRVPPKTSRLAYSGSTHEETKGESPSTPTPMPRRSKIDTLKGAQTKSQRTARKTTDPVKVLRSTAPNVQLRTSAAPPSAEQLKKLEAELSDRSRELLSAEEEATRASRGVEALTVLVHHLVNEYEAFSTPRLKSEIDRLCCQLTDVQLCLDESSATARRLEDEAIERSKTHAEEIRKQEEKHCLEVNAITEEHQRRTQEILEKHQLELREAIAKEESKHDELVQSHKCELERIENEWRTKLDQQHERHLQALQELNTSHNQQFKKAEAVWEAREKELQETNSKLIKEQNLLKQQAKKLEETLLSDKDHRLQAAKSVCTALQNEVDSLKTVVEMRNTEVHKLRDQVTDRERMTEDLESARDRVRALQAKTEDLLAQMEKKSKLERQLLADQHVLAESLQRESSANKLLSLENEELQWKLKQREQALAGTLPTATLDLVTRCSPNIPRQEDGCKSGGSSPQVTPRFQRNGSRSQTILKNEFEKRWSQSYSGTSEEMGKLFRKSELLHEDFTLESPPPSPRVKGVIEKSNSVSFILDLNDTFPEDPFLGIPSSPLLRKARTPTLSRKPIKKSFSNAALEKSNSSSFIIGRSYRDSSFAKKEKCFYHNEGNLKIGRREENVRGRSAEDIPPHTPPLFPPKYNGRGHSTSDSSDGGDVERVSPTGLAWTVPVHSKQISKRYPRSSKDIPHRFQLVPETPRLLQQPDEDEYEEIENEFVEVLSLDGEDLNSAPLTTLFAQTPSTSVSLSDSDISQCGSRGDLSTGDDSTDDEDGTQRGSLSDGQAIKWRPQDGAGEAMILPDAFGYTGNQKENLKNGCSQISKSQISSAPSSDSEDPPQHHLNGEFGLNGSWSEDVECDLTSSSEMQEL